MPINRLTLLTSLMLFSNWSQAEATIDDENAIEAQRWFEVEIILFSQPSAQATEKEYWPTDISLAYPPNWVTLQDPASLQKKEEDTSPPEASLSEYDAEEPLDLHARPDKDLSKDPLDIRVAEPTSEIDLTQAAFYLLPKELRQLNDKAKHLSRSQKHRVLFHQAWRQPVLSSDEAPALLISAGDQYGAHSELEGTIELSVARYLHLRTNLWFSEFSHNYGQERGLWPQLPTRPDLRDYKQSQLQAATLEETPNTKPNNFSQFNLNTENRAWEETMPQESINSDLLHNYQSPPNEFDNIIDQPYLPNRIALIKQKRRMRSKEVHYIDHPMVGVLVLITPYERPLEAEHINEPTPEGEQPTDSTIL